MSNNTNDREPYQGDLGDIEELMEEARRDYKPSPQNRWNGTVELVRALLYALPGARVSTGQPRGRNAPADYITPAPNPPLTVFGPDGRFIVSFLEDGRWIEADGRIRSTSGVIEGSPEALARQFINVAGLQTPRNPLAQRRMRGAPHSDGLPRLLWLQTTNTWRDNVDLSAGQRWDQHTPASICRESPASRLIVTPHDPESCTFATTSHPRWGVESLRIPDFVVDPRYATWQPPLDPIHVGDCLLTAGVKVQAEGDEREFDGEFDGTRLWFPQRVVHVEPEGSGHLRVWLARDADVANDNVTPDELPESFPVPTDQPRILKPDEALEIWRTFQLDVFCPECGNRAKPIVYGMPTSEDPSYLAIGGCIIEPNQPRYTCYCGNEWTDIKGLWL